MARSGEARSVCSSGMLLRPSACAALLAGAALAVPAAASASDGLLDPRGPVSSAIRLLLINSTAIMLVVVVPVILATLAFAFWYRASNAHAGRSNEHAYEGRIEFVVWSIPALTVILLGGVIWIGAHQLDPRAPVAATSAAPGGAASSTNAMSPARVAAGPLRVDVVALDWKWLFIYPDRGIAAVNELTIPAGAQIDFRLTSATVMNSFLVPQLGSQIYTMGGMATRLNLLASEPGEYPGISANFSGDGFSHMRFIVRAVPAEEFDAWVAQTKGAARALDEAAYAALATPGLSAPATYGAVAPELFDRIVQETAAGPQRAGTAAMAWCGPPRTPLPPPGR